MEINQITERIIGCAFTVSSTLGAGFLEKVCLLLNFGNPRVEIKRIIH